MATKYPLHSPVLSKKYFKKLIFYPTEQMDYQQVDCISNPDMSSKSHSN